MEGLEFKNFSEIPEFDKKLTEFLSSLDEELKTWHDYVEKNGKRSIPHMIAGYACLDGEKIVAIYYLDIPKKFSIRYLINSLFASKEVWAGVVVRKEYQRCGIATHLRSLSRDLARKMGYERLRLLVSLNDTTTLKFTEKGRNRIVKRTDKQIYFLADLVDDDHDQKNGGSASFSAGS